MVDFDLHLENGGQHAHLTGTLRLLQIRIDTLRAAIHFGRLFWPMRRWAPPGMRFQVIYRGWRIL